MLIMNAKLVHQVVTLVPLIRIAVQHVILVRTFTIIAAFLNALMDIFLIPQFVNLAIILVKLVKLVHKMIVYLVSKNGI